MTESAIIELKNVSKSYQESGGPKVLDGINLSVARGQKFSIIGPSGSGKSTLLNILGTLDRPSSGEMEIEGLAISGLSEKDLAMLRSEKIGFIFQLHHLLPQCSVLENVLVPTLALKTKPDLDLAKSKAEELLDRVGLLDHANKHPAKLSGGERQRVAVVRSLINGPRLLLADEPTGALDEENAAKMVELLIEVSDSEDVALVMVTHDRDLAERLGDVRELKGGKLR